MVMLLKKTFHSLKFIIRNNRKFIVGFMMIVYLFIMPLCLTSNDMEDKTMMIYKYMQQLILPLTCILLSYLFMPYVEEEYKEIISSIDRSFKYFSIFLLFLFMNVLLVPFYMIVYVYDHFLLPYLFLFMFQMLTLMSLYYLFSQFISISFVILGIMLCYMVLYSLVLYDVGFGNIYLIYKSITDISFLYYSTCIVMIILSIVIGWFHEKG